jgi:hypothetical protein
MKRIQKFVLTRSVKYLRLLFILVIVLLWASICLPAYLIELKQGTRFVTSNYWKDGSHIRFYFHGGIVGIDKRHIKQISQTTPENTPEEQKTTGRENTQQGVENNTVMDEQAVPVPEPDYKITTILEAKRYLMSEMKLLIIDIKKAKTENQ